MLQPPESQPEHQSTRRKAKVQSSGSHREMERGRERQEKQWVRKATESRSERDEERQGEAAGA